MKYGRFIRTAGGWAALQRVLPAAATVAARHGVSIANVASRFVLDQPGVAGVIVGARLGERSHVDDARRIFAIQLTDEDRTEIAAALATLQPIHGDCGDEYRTPPFLTASGDLSHHLDEMPPPYRTVPARAAHALPERHAVGDDGRLRPSGASRLAGHASRARPRRSGHASSAATIRRHRRIRHRQDRRRAAIARRHAGRHRPHPRLCQRTSATGRRWPGSHGARFAAISRPIR